MRKLLIALCAGIMLQASNSTQAVLAQPFDMAEVLERAMSASSQTSLPSNLELSPDDLKLLELVQTKKFDEALAVVRTRLAHAQNADDERQLISIEACLEAEKGNDKEALRTLRRLLGAEQSEKHSRKSQRKKSDKSQRQIADGSRAPAGQSMAPLMVPIVHKRIADLLMSQRKIEQAEKEYIEALSESGGLSDLQRSSILEPLVGCLWEQKKYSEAQKYSQQFTALCRDPANAAKLSSIGSLFWAQLQLLQIYNETGEKEKAQALQRLNEVLLARLLTLRDKVYSNADSFDEEERKYELFKHAVFNDFIAQNQPRDLSEYLWLSSEFRLRSLPLIKWDPVGQNPKLVILCIHGLGLENRAFGSFARSMTAKQFLVYALDVRGFGAWQAEFGNESVDFQRALTDVHYVIRILKRRHPGLPIFLVGESMGGAIVLRAASEFGEDFSGAISTVPSAERFGGAKMAIATGVHLLKGRNKPFDIGTQVAEQATSKKELRDVWMHDPKAKMDLTPVELIKFDSFMKTTKKRCDLIKTPVMIVQGMDDKLAKPKGSYEMFDAVTSRDKTMLILGNAEHLIFETPKQSKVLIDGVAAWLENHSNSPATSGISQVEK